MGHKYVKEEDTFNTFANGTVPKPTAQEIADNKFLRADGTWRTGGGGGSIVEVDQIVSSGTEIGGVTVDGVRTAFFAPKPMHAYSETEQRIGTWIDGKPLYEKTVNFGALPNASIKTVAHNIADVDRIWVAEGYARNASNYHSQLNATVTTSISSQWYIGVNLTNVQCETGSNRSNYSECYVVLHYTKTTDSV